MRALVLQIIKRIIEVQPLGDPRGELPLLFQLLVDLKIFPGGIVLQRRDTAARYIRQRDFNPLSPLFHRGIGNPHPH